MEKGLIQLDLSASQYVVENDFHRPKSTKSGNTSSNQVIKGGIIDGMLSGIRKKTGDRRHFMETSGVLGFPASTHNNTNISKFIGTIAASSS